MAKGNSFIGNLLYHLYSIKNSRIRKLIIKIIRRLENGDIYSINLRKIYLKYNKVEIGLYTMGGCFNPFQFDKYTKVGRYSSIAMTACVFNRDHPTDFKSTHGFFFNPVLSFCKKDIIEYNPLEIGNDVWLGHNSIIMPSVKYIGDGAVVAAGAVVHKDVPAYAIVVGNPARVVRYRFSKETIEKLLSEKWWEKEINELKDNKEFFNIFETSPETTS